MSVPYRAEQFTFFNPDGSTVPVRGWGNQYTAVFETLDGYTVVQDPESGFLEYAGLSADKERLVPTGNRAGSTDSRALGMPQHLRPTRAATRARAEAAHDAGPLRRREQRRAERKESLRAAPGGPEARAGARVVTGDYTGLVLLVQFPDVTATIPRQEVDNFCHQPGYSGYGNNGSAYDYFRDVSGGRVRYRNIVTEYYTAQHDRSYYNEQMIPAQHYQLSLEQADNRFALERNINAGDAEDLHRAPFHVAFGDRTAPNSRWWDGTASGLEIESVSALGDVMTVRTQ